MRPDFHQVLIERPRGGLRIKRQPLPRLRVADWDGEDFVEPALPRARRTKYFDDLIGPLRKWLRKQVNRPWDKVYSELCATIDRRTTVGEHLLDHVRMEVTVRCERDADGRLINIESRWRNEVEGLYVDPKSGILRWKAQISRRQYQQQVRRQQRERLRDVRKLADDRLLQRIDGIWFELVVSLSEPLLERDQAEIHPGEYEQALRQQPLWSFRSHQQTPTQPPRTAPAWAEQSVARNRFGSPWLLELATGTVLLSPQPSALSPQP